MTETVQNGRVILLPNGVTTTFALPFKVLQDPNTSKGNIEVRPYTIATATLGAALVEGTDYTVSGYGSATGSITTIGGSSPWTNAVSLIAITKTPIEQNLDYVDNDPMPAQDATTALDWIVEMLRNHEDRLLRSAKFNMAYPTSAVPNADIPVPPLNGATIYWDTTLGWTWTTVSLATLQTQAALLAGIASQIVTVAGISSSVVTCASNAAVIATVAANITNVNNVGGSIANVNTVAANLTGSNTIGTVATNIANVNLVGGSIANVNTVATNINNVNTVAGINTAVSTVATNIASVNTAAANITNINAVAGNNTNITTVAGISANVTTVAGISAAVTNVSNISAAVTNVNTIRTDVSTVSGISANVTTVAGISGNVTTVAGISANVTTVSGISANVTTVATNIANINTVAANMTTITNAANNIPKANLSASVAPTVNNDNTQGYSAGSVWADTTHNIVYLCANAATGAAQWNNTAGVSALNGLSDINLSGLADKDFLVYQTSDSKWHNHSKATALSDLLGNSFIAVAGPTTSVKTKTFRDASDTVLELGGSYTPTGTWTSMMLVTPALGTPASGNLANCTFPTLNQNTTGSAASLSISGQTGLLTFTGLASTNRAKTVRDAADTILELGGSYTPTGTWTSMTLVTPALGTPASGVLTNCTSLPAASVNSGALVNGMTATTQSATDNSTKLATTAYVDQVGGYVNFTGTTQAIGATDRGKTYNFTGSSDTTVTLANNAGITGGGSYWVILCNNGTSQARITLKATTSTVDGIAGSTGYIMYPGEIRLIEGDATNYKTQVLHGFQYVVTSSGSWMRPPGYQAFIFDIFGGGQSGASRSTTGNADGGAGGWYLSGLIPASSLVAVGSTETITIAGTAAGVSGNTNGNVGNNSTITINGTTFPTQNPTAATVPANAALASATTGALPAYYNGTYSGQGGGNVNASNVPGVNTNTNVTYGGAAGGASSSTAGGVRSGGITLNGSVGGAGGANTGGNGTNGSQPGGGGGAAVQGGTSGSGAAGQVTVRGVC